MSHFTVMVRVSPELASAHDGNINAAVTAMLAPYQANNMGDCPRQYLTFYDQETEYLEEYETGSVEMVEIEDGTRVWPWDERFRVPGTFGLGGSTHAPPAHLKRVQVPHKERYPTFDEFCSDYHSSRRDPEKGRHGYWENPNKKWDWWVIGGRWTGFFPVKAGAEIRIGKPGAFSSPPDQGHSDIVRIGEIDFDAIAKKTREHIERFWEEWQRFLAGERFRSFDSPRGLALEIGLLEVRQGPPLPGEETRAIPWAGRVPESDTRSGWHDVYREVRLDELFTEWADCFIPISTYAVLDETGWHEPGRMGWFGISHATADSYRKHKREFMRWLRSSPGDAWLVVVDCHI